MTPLIDGDILLHELGWSSEFTDKETGEKILFDFEYCQELLDKKIELIVDEVGSTKPPIIFLSDSEWLSKKLKRKFIPGFRYSIAKSKPYKGNRKNPKPFHFYNIIAYLMAKYSVVVSSDGLEADDEMVIYQVKNNNTIICSRDKDLRICPGWHYSWECGKQASIGPVETNELGWLEDTERGVIGYGLMFFYYQLLVGDSADNIPGCPKVGKVKAFKLLTETETDDHLKLVKDEYKKAEMSKEYFLEQANLLWMRQDRNKSYSL